MKIFARVCLIPPYAIIGCLTKFQSQQSTPAQRGWTMAWLVVGQFYGIMFPIVELTPHAIARAFVVEYRKTQTGDMFYLLYNSFVIGIPAIGGLIMVGMMIRDYGIYCIDI